MATDMAVSAAPSLAASYDPYPGDLERFERAILRRWVAWSRHREAEALLTAHRLRGTMDLAPWIADVNACSADLEHAEYDCRRARWRFDADTANR